MNADEKRSAPCGEGRGIPLSRSAPRIFHAPFIAPASPSTLSARIRVCLRLVAVAVALAVSASAQAQEYPTKPVRVIVGYPPGGGVDTGARLVAAALGELWGSTVLVDNRPGATGTIGADIAAKATPDGYTLLLCQIASHAINPARYKKLPYDHLRDFAPISMVGTTPNVIVVNPAQPIKTVGDLIAYARANPGKLNYGSSGVGASPR